MRKLRENVIRLLCFTYLLTYGTVFAQQSSYSNLVKPSSEQFTETQINSLRERFIQAGYRNKLCQLVGNDYMYWNIPMPKDMSANQLSEKLRIPADTLYMLTKSAVKSLFRETIGDIKQYDNIYSTIFNNPSLAINELEEKKMFISNFYVYNLYFAYDPNIILRTKEEIEADKERQFNESLIFSDSLKTYSGKFNLGALHGSYVNPTSWRDGTAIYQYKDAADGSRIFEGKFSFNQDDKYKAYGFFKDNRQIGKWTWEHGNNIITIINFDNLGKSIEGEFVVHNPSKTSVFVKGEFKNGYITNLTYVQDNVEVNGRFDKDKPIGRWYFKNEKHFYSVFSEYSNDGSLIEDWYYIEYDNSTGDKRKVRLHNMERYSPETLKDFTMRLIGRYIMRSTLDGNKQQKVISIDGQEMKKVSNDTPYSSSSFYSDNDNSNNRQEMEYMLRLSKLSDKGKELVKELATMRANGNIDPFRVMYIKQNLIRYKDEQIEIATNKLHDSQLAREYKEQKRKLLLAFKQMGI